MRVLHIYKTEPDETTKTLVNMLSEGEEVTEFDMFKYDIDYERLLDLIFERDKVVTWW